MDDLSQAIAVYHEGDARRVEFRLEDVEKLIAHGAAQLLGYDSDEGLRLTVEFRQDSASGAVSGASVLVKRLAQ